MGFMISLARKMGGKPVLIPSADQFVSAIASHADTLAKHYVLSPGVALQGLLATKQTQYALAAEHGMPLPRTKLIHSEEDVRGFAAEARFPCLLKPTALSGVAGFPRRPPALSREGRHCPDAESLLDAWRLAAAVNSNAIAQEIIEGPDTAKRVYVACYDRGGRRSPTQCFVNCAVIRLLRTGYRQ